MLSAVVSQARPYAAETRYGASVDIKRAADLYAQGRTLRQIGASSAFTRAQSATSYVALVSLCVAAALRLIQPEQSKS